VEDVAGVVMGAEAEGVDAAEGVAGGAAAAAEEGVVGDRYHSISIVYVLPQVTP
jgi:hypothetical protein